MELVATRITREMKEKLEAIAKKEQRSLSNLVRLILTQWLERYEKENPEDKRYA